MKKDSLIDFLCSFKIGPTNYSSDRLLFSFLETLLWSVEANPSHESGHLDRLGDLLVGHPRGGVDLDKFEASSRFRCLAAQA